MSRLLKLRIWDRRLLSFVPDALLDFGMLTDPNYEASAFTGVCDAEGRELYEGDITLWTFHDQQTNERGAYLYVVSFERGCYGLMPAYGDDDFQPFDNLSTAGDVLVGNRFENPYLIGLPYLRACRCCHKERPPTEFTLSSYRTGRRSTICRFCKREVDARRYAARTHV